MRKIVYVAVLFLLFPFVKTFAGEMSKIDAVVREEVSRFITQLPNDVNGQGHPEFVEEIYDLKLDHSEPSCLAFVSGKVRIKGPKSGTYKFYVCVNKDASGDEYYADVWEHTRLRNFWDLQ